MFRAGAICMEACVCLSTNRGLRCVWFIRADPLGFGGKLSVKPIRTGKAMDEGKKEHDREPTQEEVDRN